MESRIECYDVEFTLRLVKVGTMITCKVGGEEVYDFLPVETCRIWLGGIVLNDGTQDF